MAVTAAYWLWFLGAVLAFLTSVLWLTADEQSVRTANPSLADPARIAELQHILGGIALGSGILIAALARFVRRGNGRIRRTLVAFSVVLTVFFIGMIGVAFADGLFIAIPCLIASVLSYLPSASAWFARES